MRRRHILQFIFAALVVFFLISTSAAQWKIPSDAPLLTKWAKDVSPTRALPEYPRPQMVRNVWLNLNGVWQYAEAKPGEEPPTGRKLDGSILVPYPIESALSGVMKHVERLWYRRIFSIPSKWSGQRILLHFGAVDWEAKIYVNGKEMGGHRGGYDPFSIDITESLSRIGPQELIVGVFDPTDSGDQPRGKQVRKPGGIWYTPTTGIWQTVWLEPVPAGHIDGLILTPDLDAKQVRIMPSVVSGTNGDVIKVEVWDGKQFVAGSQAAAGSEIVVPLEQLKLWSPSNPFLYDLKVELVRGGKILDAVKSYFGMRKIALAKDALGINRLMLNGKFIMQVGPLDQGFWPDGLYTAPTDQALKYDIEITKSLGFNMARKHVKVEPERWYYWADKLGLLVWQDMPSGNNKTPESKIQFESELKQLVDLHRNHPSIIMWVVFNEGWGQYDTERLTGWVKQMDPSRLVNNASGWTDKNAGDVMDIHSYPKPNSPKAEAKRAVVLGEFGGLGLAIPGHTWKTEHWGYQGMKDNAQLTSKYETFLKTVYDLKDVPGLCAAIYTQTTDVEVECNGLLTYDRAVIKPNLARVAAANRGDFSKMPSPPSLNFIVPTSQEAGQTWSYALEKPAENWMKPNFDDSNWKKGFGGFGKKGTPGAVLRTEWTTNNIWMRREFTIEKIDTKDLLLLMHHDEDAKVYINGILAAKVPDWTSEYEQYDIQPEALRALKPGKNILAVTCKQTSGGQYIDVGLVRLMKENELRASSAQLPPSMGPVSVVKNVSTAKRGTLYVGNRDALVPSPLMKLPIGSIKPQGWLRHMLELEKGGMVGRLKEISPWLRWEKSAWANKEGIGERGWEELPYWLKGYGDLGYVLNDTSIINEARKWIEVMFASQTPDGWFGPRTLQTSLQGKADMWPHMVMLNVLQSYYEFSGDKRVLSLMRGYFNWQNRLPPTSFGAGYWPKLRMGDNIESVYWLFNRSGEPWLLELAKKIHDNMARWDEDVINGHNVNIAQGFREPAIYYMQSKDIGNLQAADRNYRRIMGIYGQFPGGGFASDENVRFGFTDPRQGFETCGIVEFMHSFEMLTKISGNPLWADRCEDIAFNSFPAALTPDQTALHYLTCANQIQLDKEVKSPGVQNGGTLFSYSPFEVYRCCQHNVSHGWPYYAEELWLATADNGLCLSLYSASEVQAKVGDGTTVNIAEETEYPFGETVKLKLTAPRPVKFPLYLRIPSWCKESSIEVNGKKIDVTFDPLSYAVVDRKWSNGDEVNINLQMSVAVRTWQKNKDAVSINYGPLTFALEIGEKWQRYGKNDAWPEWEVYPTSSWNYGLVLDAQDPANSFELVHAGNSIPVQPFISRNAPLQLRAKARKIPGWQQDYLGLVGVLQQSPARSNEPEETVTLVPMGGARLRISLFPTTSPDPDAHEWTAPPRPKPVPYKISYSFMNRYDSERALADGIEPSSSGDEGVSRFTWWDHRGTKEWVEYELKLPQVLSRSSIYWYDDSEDGECRVPESWKLFYKRGEEWIPIDAQYGTKRDAWNSVQFAPVEAAAVRIEIQLKKGFSGGILEWKIE